MNIEKLAEKLDLGKYLVWKNRLQGHVAIINFIMILYLFLIEEPLGFAWVIWLILIIMLVPLILLFDVIFLMPSSYKYVFDKNPEMVKLKKRVDAIYNKVCKEV